MILRQYDYMTDGCVFEASARTRFFAGENLRGKSKLGKAFENVFS